MAIDLNRFLKDLTAGVTVAIVALPLAIGFGITSGVTAASGIATAIIAGAIVSFWGGSRFQISGPTGAMTVVLIPIVQKYGAAVLPVVGVMAGIALLILSAVRAGELINRVPKEVIEGFTVGIAVIIALQQLPIAFDAPKGSGERTLEIAWHTLQNIITSPLKLATVSILALTLLVKFGIVRLIESIGLRNYIPASFMAILISTSVVQVFGIDVSRIGDIPRNVFALQSLDLSTFTTLLMPALAIALLAAIESLLSARVADELANSNSLKPNRELAGQGLGTIASSLLGGIPATGAIARTSVNVRSNAQSKWSGVIHAFAILLIILFAAPLFAKIPMAAIAGVLIGTSFRIFNRASFKEVLILGKSKLAVYLVTAVSTIAIDLIWGIAIGTALHLLFERSQRRS